MSEEHEEPTEAECGTTRTAVRLTMSEDELGEATQVELARAGGVHLGERTLELLLAVAVPARLVGTRAHAPELR